MSSADDNIVIFKVNVKSASKVETVHDAILEGIANSQAEIGGCEKVGLAVASRFTDGPVPVGHSLFPFSSDQIEDVAISPPYVAVLLKNGKACRFTIKHVEAEDAKTPKTTRKRDSTHHDSDILGEMSNNPQEIVKSASNNTQKSVYQQKSSETSNERNLIQLGNSGDGKSASNETDMSDVSDFSPETKRRKTERIDDGASNYMIFNENPNEIELSFEEQRLDRLSDFIQNIEERQAELNQTSNSNDIGDSVIFGRYIRNPITMSQSETESSRVNEVRSSECSSDPHRNRPGNTSSDRTHSSSSVLLPPGFRPLSDKLDFMKKSKKKTIADGNEDDSPSEKKKFEEILFGSFEWIFTDSKDTKFSKISAMYSEFLLVSKNDAMLWSWPIESREANQVSNTCKAFPHPIAEFIGIAKERVSILQSNTIRTTIATESGKLCTFYDSLFADSCRGQIPNLIQRLTKKASMDPKLHGETITDIKCGNFYSAVLTKSGKVFWWGLAPEHSILAKHKKSSHRIHSRNGFEIGDVVALKEKKAEIGSLVMSTCLLDGPKIGWVKRIHDMDRNGDSFDLKHYTVELINVDARGALSRNQTRPNVDEQAEKDCASASPKTGKTQGEKEKIWSSDNVIFLEERASTVGEIVALDGNYAVVEIKSESRSVDEKQLKVCQKSTLAKVSDSSTCLNKDMEECVVNERRYDEFIRNNLEYIVDPYNCENQFHGHKAVAISATKRGITLLTNRRSDGKAFLVHPEGLKEDNSKVFTCSGDIKKSSEEIMQSDGNVTADCEAACSVQCNLTIDDDDDDDPTKIPALVTLDGPDVCLVIDSNGGLLPVRYGSCLLQSTVLDAFPFRILRVMEARFYDEGKDGKALTVIAVPRKLNLVPAIVRGNRNAFDQVFKKVLTAASVSSQEDASGSSSDDQISKFNWLYEKSSGNQNILHLCATNLLLEKTSVEGGEPTFAANFNEVYMLKRILSSQQIRPHTMKLLKQRDALGCTPFTAALVAKNSQAAYCILEAVLEWSKISKDTTLFKEAICPSSVSGMTPVHHLIFNSRAQLSPNCISTNGLLVSNLPSNYSPRMLLQLFKERYASAYRAFIPVPTEKWKIKTARGKLSCQKNSTKKPTQSKTQQSPAKVQVLRNSQIMRTLRHSIEVINRADALRATAKQGLVMFSDIDEMYQALTEMDKFPLVCEAERPHTGLMSFAKYILSVRLAEKTEREVEKPEISRQVNPLTRHTVHPTLQNTYLMFPRSDISSAGITRGIHHQRHIVPRAMRASNMVLSQGGITYGLRPQPSPRHSKSNRTATKDSVTGSKENYKESYDESNEDEIRCRLLATLLQAIPEFASLLNQQQETALAFYLRNAERLSPNGLFECLSKWRPCYAKSCLYQKLAKSTVAAKDLPKIQEIQERRFNDATVKKQFSKICLPGESFTENFASNSADIHDGYSRHVEIFPRIPNAGEEQEMPRQNQRPHIAVSSRSRKMAVPSQSDASFTYPRGEVTVASQFNDESPSLKKSNMISGEYATPKQQREVSASNQIAGSTALQNQAETSVLNSERISNFEMVASTSRDILAVLSQGENVDRSDRGNFISLSSNISGEEQREELNLQQEPASKRPRSDTPVYSNDLTFESILQSRNDSPLLNSVEPLEPSVLPDFGDSEMPAEIIGSVGSSVPFDPMEPDPQSDLDVPTNSARQGIGSLPLPLNHMPWIPNADENMQNEPSIMVSPALMNQPLLDEILDLNNSRNLLMDSEIDGSYASSSNQLQEEIIVAERDFNRIEPLSGTFGETLEWSKTGSKQESVTKKRPVKNACCCADKIKNISVSVLQRFNFTLVELSSNWWSVAASILGMSFGNLQTNEKGILSAEKLDIFVSSLVSNPFPVVLENLLRTICREFPKDLSLEEIFEMFFKTQSTSEILSNYPADRLSLLVSKRFLRSVIRRLSFYLSKKNGVDSSLRFEIGRFAKQKEDNKEDRIFKSIKDCLRSFSWLSVIEIFKAAEAIIEPVRTGIAKAQPRGIMSDLCGIGRIPRATGPQSLLGAIPGMHVQNRRLASNLRSTNITIASRLPEATTRLGPTRLTGRDRPRSHNESDNRTASISSSQGSWATGIENNLGMNSPLAWTLNGHIRVSETYTSRGLPDYLQNIPDPSMLPSIHAGNCYLSQMYCRLVKEAVDLAAELINEENNCKNHLNDSSMASMSIKLSKSVEEQLKTYAKDLCNGTWNWMTNIIDSVENQLRSGASFDTQRYTTRSLMSESSGLESSSFGRPPNIAQSYVSKPEEYLLYLLKKRTDEADNAFPVLDLMSYSHVTFVLDAHFYMLKNWPEGLSSSKGDNRTVADQEMPTPNGSAIDEETLKFFSLSKDDFDTESFKERCKTMLDKARSPALWLKSSAPVECKNAYGSVSNHREQLKSNWSMTISAFAKLFLAEAPGMERECFLAEHAGSAGRISRFQRSLAATREEGSTGSPQGRENRPLSITIKRSSFVRDGLKVMIAQMDNHPFSNLNVRFEGEEGTGPGVNRGFFTGFTNALKAQTVKFGNWQAGIFCQPGQLPGQANVFALVSPTTASRKILSTDEEGLSKFFQHWQTVYESIGRFIGLSLWFNQTIPIVFTRPVLKYLLKKEKEITFEDLAYHNSTLFDSFSQMISDANCASMTETEFQDAYCCNFEAVLNGQLHELIPGGYEIKVTRDRVLEYVRLYANFLMVDSVKMELESLQSGLHQMIPKQLLEPLTPEDLQLLLSGGAEDIDISRLKSMIRFNNSRVCSKETLAEFKGWFWSIVSEMNSLQRNQLLYFATGSAALPAFDNKVGNNEELLVTVDVINKNNSPLPVVSTCGQRLSIPLYSTKKELKRKLLQAIQCLSYGLG